MHGMTEAEELALWACLFTTGHDFFHDLAPLGIPAFQDDHDARERRRVRPGSA